MKTDKFGQLVFSENDIVNLYLQGFDLEAISHLMMVDGTVDLEAAASILESMPEFLQYHVRETESVEEFDQHNQSQWFMPQEYQDLDIAAYVLSLCESDAELQRCGQELLLFQERGLFDLLRYLKYLVDVMTENRLIWGVGRGSSVSSYVLYKLGVHRVDSLFYDLDITEFLR